MERFGIDACSGEGEVVGNYSWALYNMPLCECSHKGRRERMEMLFKITRPASPTGQLPVDSQRLKPILIID